MRFLASFKSRFAVASAAGALVAVGCSNTPTQPNTTGSPSQPAALSEARADHLNPTQLTARGWSCRVPPVPNRVVCSHPNQGFPSPATPIADRPATFTLLVFDSAGNFIGTQLVLREDLYSGQTCESTGGPYIYRALIGYYECLHTVGG